MIRIAICDDEPLIVSELSEKVNRYFAEAAICADICNYACGADLLYGETNFDVIFLDIQMARLSGLETAKALRHRSYKGILVFITAFEEYVYDSFEVQAFDYLLKPVEDKHFVRTMDRALISLREQKQAQLLIKRKNAYKILAFDDILFCEIIDRKVYIHTHKETIDYYDKMNSLEKKLDQRFFRCHRSYLINLKYVKSYVDGQATLDGGEQIPVSRLRGQEFSARILQYMKEWSN